MRVNSFGLNFTLQNDYHACVCVGQTNEEDRGLTYEVELIGKDPEEGLTVQSEHDGEVGAQRAPHKHMVDNCPEACVKSDLHNHTQTHMQKTAEVHS